ncbi:2TM domain-containing protein [Maribacter confluentis]|uniref:2TM domain-containing protein n=2 Tax=Maribacter TaxID=252356 RepID=A0ABT8RMR3_9FLAO|nr:2TM domain-containing protein [Maribacter confluentis]MDO1511426.1 2TM domain-containing protein [Maribacter confluentis]
MNKLEQHSKEQRALLRIESIKKFFKHCRLFITANVLILFVSKDIFNWFDIAAITDNGFKQWVMWNIASIPIIWSIVLTIHALVVFRIRLVRFKWTKPEMLIKWEQKMIQDIIQKEL